MPPFMFPLLFVVMGALADMPRVQQLPVIASPPVFAVPLGDLALRAARVALHTAGLSEGDGVVDSLASRARASNLLPEVALRATQSEAGVKDYSSDTGTVSTTGYGPGFSIQGTLTFHLEKLAYSGQETRLERLRLERMEARSHITQRVIEEVARWSRATAEEHESPEGTPAHLDAFVRRSNAQMALDVWTRGWFSAFLAGRDSR